MAEGKLNWNIRQGPGRRQGLHAERGANAWDIVFRGENIQGCWIKSGIRAPARRGQGLRIFWENSSSSSDVATKQDEKEFSGLAASAGVLGRMSRCWIDIHAYCDDATEDDGASMDSRIPELRSKTWGGIWRGRLAPRSGFFATQDFFSLQPETPTQDPFNLLGSTKSHRAGRADFREGGVKMVELWLGTSAMVHPGCSQGRHSALDLGDVYTDCISYIYRFRPDDAGRRRFTRA